MGFKPDNRIAALICVYYIQHTTIFQRYLITIPITMSIYIKYFNCVIENLFVENHCEYNIHK